MSVSPVEFYRFMLAVTLTLIVLAVIALPFLKPGSPSFAADILALFMLTALLAAILVMMKQALKRSPALGE